ncbi:Ribonuclease H-like superfamily protein [Gossypium australe]|uniref:Ribonuclease H-like superfamily protein n=1 Tax=Gossypium australe TaxID=47621 RepID=A0A5B6W0J8_9ROSI|nr:Ribonuclease H-like superfamily protein [Gossypium australe]
MERFADVPGGSCHDCFGCQAYRFLQEPSSTEEMHGGYWHFTENPRRRRHGCPQLVSPMVDKHYYVKARFEENRSSLCRGKGFSTLLEDAKQQGLMRGASVGRERFSINHLFFADDCILFGDATQEGVCTVRDIIRKYEKSAGKLGHLRAIKTDFGSELMVGAFDIYQWGTVRSQLENIMNKFWWSNNKMKTGIHWSGWNKLCLSKFDGGFGFKNLFLFNKALLAKQVWRVLTQPQCLLARVLKARYFSFTDILAAKIGSYPSFTWRSICSARDLIEDGMLWSTGKGDRVNIWNYPWLPRREKNRLSGHDIRNRWITVNHLMQPDSATWNDKLIRNLFDEDTANRICYILISGSSLEDTIVWKFEGSGSYSVQSGYRRKLAVDPICPLCKDDVESTDHLLWTCGTLRQVWNCLQLHIQFVDESVCAKRSFVRVFAAGENQQQCIIAISLRSLWFRRNKLIHEGVKFQFEEVVETYLFQNIADPFVAEARACERALLFAKTMGFQRLEVEGDALSVIKSIKKKGTDTSVIRSITHHIYLMGLSFDQIVYHFTPRTANGAAHASTLKGRRTDYFGAWFHELPSSVISIARKEELQTNLAE